MLSRFKDPSLFWGAALVSGKCIARNCLARRGLGNSGMGRAASRESQFRASAFATGSLALTIASPKLAVAGGGGLRWNRAPLNQSFRASQ